MASAVNAEEATGVGVSKRERFLFTIQKGVLVPHDEHTVRRLREKGYRVGDTVSADLTKPRNPGFHRLAHAFGQLVADNIDGFEHMDAHRVLKRLQLESGIGCEELLLQVPGVGMVPYKIPESLSFANMDESRFRSVFSGLCAHVSRTYWPSLTPEQVEDMAAAMPEVA